MLNILMSQIKLNDSNEYYVTLEKDWSAGDHLIAFMRLTKALKKNDDQNPNLWKFNNNFDKHDIVIGLDEFEAKMQLAILEGDLEAAKFKIIHTTAPKLNHPYR